MDWPFNLLAFIGFCLGIGHCSPGRGLGLGLKSWGPFLASANEIHVWNLALALVVADTTATLWTCPYHRLLAPFYSHKKSKIDQITHAAIKKGDKKGANVNMLTCVRKTSVQLGIILSVAFLFRMNRNASGNVQATEMIEKGFIRDFRVKMWNG